MQLLPGTLDVDLKFSCTCIVGPNACCELFALYRTAVDSYLRARDPSGPFLASLRGRIALSQQESIMQGTRYNVPLLNALVFYVGIEVSSWSVAAVNWHCFLLNSCVL